MKFSQFIRCGGCASNFMSQCIEWGCDKVYLIGSDGIVYKLVREVASQEAQDELKELNEKAS